MIINVSAEERLQCKLGKSSGHQVRVIELRNPLRRLSKMSACDLLVVKVAVGQVTSLSNVGAKFGRVEFGDSGRYCSIDDRRLILHGVVTKHAYDGVEPWKGQIILNAVSEGKCRE
jgi:hypothetical protein